MDYKKMYEEALAHAREIHCNEEEKRKDMEFIFPVLKENEDEEIKKELINYLKYRHDSTTLSGEMRRCSKWISWLEKQGNHQKFCDSIQVGDRVTRNEDGVLVNLSQLNRVAKKHKKQDKQKLIEWKQENREELTEFENAMMHIGGSFFGENAGLDPNDTDTIKEQAELLLELAPKTEWSEEDESMYTRTLGILGKCYMRELPTKVVEELNWFKSIRTRIKGG